MTGIKRFMTNRLTWVSAAFVVLFCVIARATQASTLAEASRTSVVALAFMGLIVYSGVAIQAY